MQNMLSLVTALIKPAVLSYRNTFDRGEIVTRDELKHLSANLDYATVHNSQAARGSKRKIEDAVANMRPAVGDTNYHGLAGRKISNANFRAEWQSAMGCGRQISIEGRTARRFSSLI